MKLRTAFIGVVILIAISATLPISVSEAQSTLRSSCSVQQQDTLVPKGTKVTFIGCAYEVAAWGASTSLHEALGQWSVLPLKVDNSGAIYAFLHNQWVYQDRLPDNDRDGIRYDACPSQAETVNHVFDTDGCPDTIDDLVNLAKQDIDAYWRGLFRNNHISYYPPRAITPYRGSQRPIRTACGWSEPDNAFYCRNDSTIYYDRDLLETIVAIGDFGDFGVVTVLAHEWGHHIQSQLADANVPSGSIGIELQADCFAGSYGRYIADGQSELLRLDEGDLQEGTHLLYALGDDLPWFDPQAHGSPQQRMRAFINGVYDFDSCLP